MPWIMKNLGQGACRDREVPFGQQHIRSQDSVSGPNGAVPCNFWISLLDNAFWITIVLVLNYSPVMDFAGRYDRIHRHVSQGCAIHLAISDRSMRVLGALYIVRLSDMYNEI